MKEIRIPVEFVSLRAAIRHDANIAEREGFKEIAKRANDFLDKIAVAEKGHKKVELVFSFEEETTDQQQEIEEKNYPDSLKKMNDWPFSRDEKGRIGVFYKEDDLKKTDKKAFKEALTEYQQWFNRYVRHLG